MTCPTCGLQRGTATERHLRRTMLPFAVDAIVSGVDISAFARCWAPDAETCAWIRGRDVEERAEMARKGPAMDRWDDASEDDPVTLPGHVCNAPNTVIMSAEALTGLGGVLPPWAEGAAMVCLQRDGDGVMRVAQAGFSTKRRRGRGRRA